FYFPCSSYHSFLPSFPTRRSSDLPFFALMIHSAFTSASPKPARKQAREWHLLTSRWKNSRERRTVSPSGSGISSVSKWNAATKVGRSLICSLEISSHDGAIVTVDSTLL